jgi:hypothetical protein
MKLKVTRSDADTGDLKKANILVKIPLVSVHSQAAKPTDNTPGYVFGIAGSGFAERKCGGSPRARQPASHNTARCNALSDTLVKPTMALEHG